MNSLAGTTINTSRLILTPLRAEDADEIFEVLNDERLHTFIGGNPASRDGLRERYRRLAAGSPDAQEAWLNWIIRRRHDFRPIGTVQAGVTEREGTRHAAIAWVIGVPWQNQGFASEAAAALVGWLREHHALDITAHIHPRHSASARVAARAGLEPTSAQVDGEQVWRVPRARRLEAADVSQATGSSQAGASPVEGL